MKIEDMDTGDLLELKGQVQVEIGKRFGASVSDNPACVADSPKNERQLADALALVDFGPCREADRPQDWINVAAPMCAYCRGVASEIERLLRLPSSTLPARSPDSTAPPRP